MNKLAGIINKIDLSKIIESGDQPLFYMEIITKILRYLENNDSATFQELIKYVGGSDRRVLRLLDQMVELGVIKFLFPRFYLRNEAKGYTYRPSDMICDKCESKIVRIDQLKPVFKFTQNVLRERPKPTFIFDQRPVNAKTIVHRVAYMIWRGDVQGKKVVFLGDDDLTSLALAYTKIAKEIVVFDIDRRILYSIKKISQKYGLKIKVVEHDLLKNTPSIYLNYFDTFMADPTPTLKPLTLFTNRGLEILRKEAEKVGYISLYPSHMKENTDFQKNLMKMNVLITDIIPFFNQYDFLKYTYSQSDMELLKKYASKESKISFSEKLMRIETTSISKAIPLEITATDLAGRATKRVLKDHSADPVLSVKGSPEFLKGAVLSLKNSFERR